MSNPPGYGSFRCDPPMLAKGIVVDLIIPSPNESTRSNIIMNMLVYVSAVRPSVPPYPILPVTMTEFYKETG